jgi:hypothetical protein
MTETTMATSEFAIITPVLTPSIPPAIVVNAPHQHQQNRLPRDASRLIELQAFDILQSSSARLSGPSLFLMIVWLVSNVRGAFHGLDEWVPYNHQSR